MAAKAKTTTSTVIPALRYRDATAAIDFLCLAFGFEKHLVVPGDNGKIAHAQLTFGNGMIILGSGAWRPVRSSDPSTLGGRAETGFCGLSPLFAHPAEAQCGLALRMIAFAASAGAGDVWSNQVDGGWAYDADGFAGGMDS